MTSASSDPTTAPPTRPGLRLQLDPTMAGTGRWTADGGHAPGIQMPSSPTASRA
jgi:hypothetical protein